MANAFGSAIRNMPARGFLNRHRHRYRYRMGVFSSISIPIPIPMAISMGSSQFAPYCELLHSAVAGLAEAGTVRGRRPRLQGGAR